jgi:hypothetical protein
VAQFGVFTLFAALFMMVGGLFIGMGILGEYVGRNLRRGPPAPPFCRAQGARGTRRELFFMRDRSLRLR